MSALYQQVAEGIMARIAQGELQVGDRLPPEQYYAASLGISRSTLRLAFAELEAAGVLRRKKRAGTEIISATPVKRFNMATTGIAELLSLGRDTQFEIFGTRSVQTEDIAPLHGLKSETGYWLEVHGARTMAGEARPFSVNRVYVPARFAGIEPVLKARGTSVFRAIEDRFDVAVGRVSQVMRAIACPAAEAQLMGLAEGAPALQITAQLFVQDGQLMEVSVAIFDPERFEVRTDVQIV